MTAGDYTVTWASVTGWTTPNPAAATQSLATNGTLAFTGTYVQNGGVPAGFVSISAGEFTMGSPTTEAGREDDETQHLVTLTRGFYMKT
jgi:formylglycine-generating enzyme required for sulfatase activity